MKKLAHRLIMSALVLIMALFALPAFAERTIEGRVTKVRDVDTIVVAGTPVRLNGVDGPETSTRAGRDARSWMVRLVEGRMVTCQLNGDRTYDRWVGTCFINGRDIGSLAIEAGQALDCARFSDGRYRHLETTAARSRLKRSSYC